MNNTMNISKAAAAMGRKGGRSKSPAKVAAVRANGSKANKSRHDWDIVDWALSDADIAFALGCSRARVRVVRLRQSSQKRW